MRGGNEAEKRTWDWRGQNTEFLSVHTKIIDRKRRKELNIFTNLNSAQQSCLLMNAEHFSYHSYTFLFILQMLLLSHPN